MTDRFHDISSAPVSKKLWQLAGEPYDLRVVDALTEENRLEKYVCRSGPFKLLYSTQRVNDQVLVGLQELADQCGLVHQFADMRKGEFLNKIHGHESENRQVLHTACRDLFSGNPNALEATQQMKAELVRLKEFLNGLENGTLVNEQGQSFTTLVNVGIGGSDLGPRSIYEALKPFGKPGRRVHFIANVDPDDAAAVLAQVDLPRTLVNIVSKSGTTLETLTNERMVVRQLEAEGLDPARHCVAVTGQGSPMDNPDRYLRSFYMFDYIGGRYSSTSMVGCVMLGFFLGYEQLEEFLHGAAEIDDVATNADINENLPLLLALLGVWNHNFLGASTLAVLPYSQGLHRFPAHLQQCDMESNGKSINRFGKSVEYLTGPVVWGEPGTNGQHAFYQLLHQGTEIVPVEFIGFVRNQYGVDLDVEGTSSQEKLLANLLAQALAMATGQSHENPNKVFSGNRPSSVLIAERLTPRTMGALLAIYEAKIVLQGFVWNINSFDQEGVQLGKVLATRILNVMGGEQCSDANIETQFLKAALQGTNDSIGD